MLKNYTILYERLGRWCNTQERVDIDWAPWNQVLGVMSLIAEPGVLEATLAIDATFWRTVGDIERGADGRSNWLRYRAQLEEAQLAFVNAARARLIVGSGRVASLVGRPADYAENEIDSANSGT